MISIKKLLKRLLVAGFGFCVVWGFYQFSVLPRIGSYVAYPVLQGYRVMVDPIRSRWQQYCSKVDLHEQLKTITKENEEMRAQNIYLRASLAYMQGIKELRAFNSRYKKEGKIAHVLTRHFSDKEHFFYIDTGARDDIEKDMVVTYKNNLIGKITQVYPWYSKVCLITDRLCKVAAYCATTKAHGIYEGANRCGEASLCYVTHLSDAKQGELVLSSGEGLVFPNGLALGRITACQVDGLYKNITVKPLCDMDNLEYCTVLSKG